jgi:hypothetical protein
MKLIIDKKCNIELIKDEFGQLSPVVLDVLKYIGLDRIDESQIQKMNELIQSDKYKKAFKYIADIQGITVAMARSKIARYHIVSNGLIIKYSSSEDDRLIAIFNCYLELPYVLKGFDDTSKELLLQLFEKEGFASKVIKELIIFSDNAINKVHSEAKK